MGGINLTTADFAIIFRHAAARGVEYSYDAFDGEAAVMIGGGAELILHVKAFVAGISAIGGWLWPLERFIELVRPSTYLLRADEGGGLISALTIYVRFPHDPGQEEFATAMRSLQPFRWDGPSLGAVAAVLGCGGPRGLALRVTEDGLGHAAVYFRLETARGQLDARKLTELAELCAIPPSISEDIVEDLRPFSRPGQIGVIGIDSRNSLGLTTLKFDPANVPLSLAMTCVHRKGAPQVRCNQIQAIAHSLRSRHSSYLGLKYNASGFAGARFYFSIEPSRLSSPLLPSIRSDFTSSPVLRAPHY